jgi:hypothetical protein
VKSEYTSNRDVAATPAIPIAVDDPRLDPFTASITKSTIGGPIDVIGMDGKSLTAGGTTFNNPSGTSYVNGTSGGGNYTPPTNGQPSIDAGYGPIVLSDISNVTASWSGLDLVINFDWDYDDPANQTVSEFIVELTVDGETERTPLNSFIPNRTQTAQTVTVTALMNEAMFNIHSVDISAICVLAMDPFYNKSSSVCAATVPTYVVDLPTPVITVSTIQNGYTVSYTAPTQTSYRAIEIVEYESSSSTEPTGVTYSKVYFDNLNPIQIIVPNTNARWVKARFSTISGKYGAYSAAQKVTPTNPVTVDNTGPEAPSTGSATAGIDNSTGATVGFNAYVDIQWSAVSDTTLRGYRIRFRENGTSNPYSYVDSPGTGTSFRLSGLAIGTVYEIAIASYDQFNNISPNGYFSIGTAQATGTPFIGKNVTTVGYFGASANGDTGTFKFGYGVQDSGGVKRGLVFNSNNYWYIDSSQSALFKLGGDVNNYIEWNGQVFNVAGNITARSGSFAGNVFIDSGGSLYSGLISGGNLFGAGYILNSSGLTFNSSSVSGITTISAADGLFTTKHANIGGWDINDVQISKTNSNGNISLNSANGQIFLEHDNNPGKGAGINSPKSINDIVFWAGSDDYTSTTNKFKVTLEGDLTADDVTLSGDIYASLGGFGTLSADKRSIANGWEIDANGIVAVNDTNTGGFGRIKVGDYSIKSNASSDLIIYDDEAGSEILETNTSTATTDPKRIFLGDFSRHVEVRKSASLSGLGTNVTVEAATSTQLSAYRSGGLRNIFTVTQNNYNQSYNLDQDGNNNSYSILYPSANKGDLMVVYDPNDPSSEGNWNKITAVYINTRGLTGAPINTVAPAVTPTSGGINSTVFTTTNGTWTGDTPISYTYQWKYNDQGSVWIAAPGTNNQQTYTAPESWDPSIYGGSLRCYVTATNGISSATAYSNTVTLDTNPAIIDGPFFFVTESSITITFAAVNTQSWAIYKIDGTLLDSGNGSFGDAYDSGLLPSTNYVYVIRLYPELNQGGTYVPVFGDATTSSSGTTTTTTTTTTQPPATFGITSTSSTDTSVTYSWANPPSGTAWYSVWINSEAASIVTSTSKTFENLNPGTSYTVYVVAKNSSNSDLASDTATISTTGQTASAPVNTTAPSVSPSSGTAGSTQFLCSTGTWTGSPTPTYTYQWKYNDQGSLWLSISGATSSTYTPPSNYVTLYGSGLRCYVTATNASGSSTVYAPSVTVSAPAATTTTSAPTTTTSAPGTTAAPTTTTTAAPGTTAAPTTTTTTAGTTTTAATTTTAGPDCSNATCANDPGKACCFYLNGVCRTC